MFSQLSKPVIPAQAGIHADPRLRGDDVEGALSALNIYKCLAN